MKEMVGGCCVCSDDRGWPENPLVYCDGQSCTVAVHQACYGIVTVPTGPWYCRKCESQERSVKVKCELCPSKYGALKRTDNSGWAHVVCALYIPEVRFGNVTTMEPIQLQLIPAERFNKLCYICEEGGKASSATVGACMQCNKPGCKQQFHVTCAQGLGLLCEEAGNYFDNVKYCGYCQHHYSKLKKGGHVKPIPPYKPVSSDTHLSDSNSEKEAESAANAPKPTGPPAASSGKRKSSSNAKISSSSSKNSGKSTTSSSSSSSSSHPKSVHNSSSKSAEKAKSGGASTASSAAIKSAKTAEEVAPTDVQSDSKPDKLAAKEEPEAPAVDKVEVKENKSAKKRKTNSRTPTPITIVPTDNISVVISGAANLSSEVTSTLNATGSIVLSDKKEPPHPSGDLLEKSKKVKSEPPQQITALNSAIASTKAPISPATAKNETDTATSIQPTTQSIIQTAPAQQMNSLVVSVPLHNTSLSPSTNQIITNSLTNNASAPIPYVHIQTNETVEAMQVESSNEFAGSNLTSNDATNSLTSEVGELKITYEKQPGGSATNMDLERITPTEELPTKRSRSQSTEKPEKGRSKKRGSNGVAAYNNHNKRASRSQLTTPSPQSNQPLIKESPPSSPSSESLGAAPSGSNNAGRKKGRKSAPPSASSSSSSTTKDSKDNIKLFQNGLSAPHMMGNQLNPNSNMAQKMTDHLNSELEAHSIFNPNENNGNLVGPQLHHRVISQARSSSTGGSSTASGTSGFSSMLGGGGGAIPQTLDQLLERQWEQGSQFLMEQAQHFDIASLLSCLHQLRAENMRLEEHVSSLLQRRDHLLAVNARLAIPLTGPPATPQSNHPHTVNNIHPAVAANHAEVPRSRHSASYTSHAGPHNPPLENGLPTESSQTFPTHSQHRTNPPQRSPTVRHSPASTGGYPNGGLIRQSADTGGRSAPRSQPYTIYQSQGPSSGQQQMVIRREPDIHHQQSSKPPS